MICSPLQAPPPSLRQVTGATQSSQERKQNLTDLVRACKLSNNIKYTSLLLIEKIELFSIQCLGRLCNFIEKISHPWSLSICLLFDEGQRQMPCCHASIEHSQPGKVEKLALAEVRHVIKGGSSKSLLLAGRSNVDFLLLRFYCSHACSPSWRASHSIPEIARTLTQSHRSFSRLQVASQRERQIMKGRFLYFWWAFRLSQNWTWHCLAHHHVWWLKFWTQGAGGLRNTIVRKAVHALQPHQGFIARSRAKWMPVWAELRHVMLRFHCSHACSPSRRASYYNPEIARTLTQSHRSFSRLQVASQHEKQIMKGRFLYFWWAFRLSQNWTWHCLAHHHVWWLKFWTQGAGGLRNTIVRKAAHVLQPIEASLRSALWVCECSFGHFLAVLRQSPENQLWQLAG